MELAGALRRWKLNVRRVSTIWSFRCQTDSRCIAVRRCARLVAGAQSRRIAEGQHALAASLVCVGADHGGAPVTEVQSLLGHSSPAVTLKVYSHWFKNVETDSVDRLAKSLTTGSKNLDTFWTLWRLLRRQIPHKYLISLSGEVAEWSKAPDC